MLAGFPQLRHNDSAVTLSSPVLPEHATGLKLRGFAYLGSRVDIAYDATSITFTLQATPDAVSQAATDAATQEDPSSFSSSAADTLLLSSRYVAPTTEDQRLTLFPATTLGERSNRGRVRLGGHILAAPPLVVTDGIGRVYSLVAGVPVVLPVGQTLTLSAAVPSRDLPTSGLGFDVGAW